MGDPAVASKFTAAELCPSVVPVAPLNKLTLNWEGTDCDFGTHFWPQQLKNSPRVQFKADEDAMYSLVMVDPDNLSRAKPVVAEWLHYLVLNIPASNLIDGILGGQVVMPYGSPGPQPRTGEHRYVILLWEHAGRRLKHNKPDQRAKFSIKKFVEKHELGAPIAGNFFISANRDQA